MRPATHVTFLLAVCLVALAPDTSHARPIGFSVATTGSNDLHRIDLESGLTEAIAAVGPEVEGLAFHPVTGDLFGVQESEQRLIRIDTKTGDFTPVGTFDTANSLGDMGLTFDDSGNLWMSVESPTPQLFSVDPSSGRATFVGSTGFAITGLASSGDDVFGLRSDAVLFDVNVDTGTVTLIGDLDAGLRGSFEGGIAFDADGVLWGLMTEDNTTSQIVNINIDTGLATLGPSVSLPFHGLAIAQVPIEASEPGTLLLFLCSIVIMGVFTEMRRSRCPSVGSSV